MIEHIKGANTNPALEDPVFREDDFSLQMNIPGDEFFFVRLTLPTEDSLDFSDLNPGSLGVDQAGSALRMFLDRFPSSKSSTVSDVYPGWDSDPAFMVELQKRVTVLRKIFAVAKNIKSEAEVVGSLTKSNGKYNITFEFLM